MRKNGFLTNGKFEGLTHIANASSQFTMVATDQRGSLKRMINPANPQSVPPEEMKDVKRKLIQSFGGKESLAKASGILIDPEYSFETRFLQSCNIRADVGMLMGIEASGYGEKGEFAPMVQIFNGLDIDEAVNKIKWRGASAVKMLVYYHPDSPTRRHQESMVKVVGNACLKQTIPFLLEPMSHSLPNGPHKKDNPKEFSRIKPAIVIETARELTKPEYGIDVLKCEFPVNLNFVEELGQDPAGVCQELDLVSQTPWVLLSAGVNFDEFKKSLIYAVENGASGFLCGRALWKDAVGRKDMTHFLVTTGVNRLNELVEIVKRKARPWYKKYVDTLSAINLVRGEETT
jgi:tagatose 1,6-diphosphate aldolase